MAPHLRSLQRDTSTAHALPVPLQRCGLPHDPANRMPQVRNLEFALDWIFHDTIPQEEIYQIAAHDRVEAVLNGYNATLVAYGQTV